MTKTGLARSKQRFSFVLFGDKITLSDASLQMYLDFLHNVYYTSVHVYFNVHVRAFVASKMRPDNVQFNSGGAIYTTAGTV